jgi:hypothetical protein
MATADAVRQFASFTNTAIKYLLRLYDVSKHKFNTQ